MRRALYIRESIITTVIALILAYVAFVIPSKLVLKYLGVDVYLIIVFSLVVLFVLRYVLRKLKRSKS